MAWFPLASDIIESEPYRKMTPTEKVFFLDLVSRFNQYGPFDLPDLRAAVLLRCSEKTIRRARAKFREIGWIDARPGFKDRWGRGVATRYLRVKWARPDEAAGFAKISRFTFQAVVYGIFFGLLEPADAVVYLSLFYWRDRCRAERAFHVPKTTLRELSGVRDAPERVGRVAKAFTFRDGTRLFEWRIDHHRLHLTNWSQFSDPEEDPRNARLAKLWEAKLEEAYRALREGR